MQHPLLISSVCVPTMGQTFPSPQRNSWMNCCSAVPNSYVVGSCRNVSGLDLKNGSRICPLWTTSSRHSFCGRSVSRKGLKGGVLGASAQRQAPNRSAPKRIARRKIRHAVPCFQHPGMMLCRQWLPIALEYPEYMSSRWQGEQRSAKLRRNRKYQCKKQREAWIRTRF